MPFREVFVWTVRISEYMYYGELNINSYYPSRDETNTTVTDYSCDNTVSKFKCLLMHKLVNSPLWTSTPHDLAPRPGTEGGPTEDQLLCSYAASQSQSEGTESSQQTDSRRTPWWHCDVAPPVRECSGFACEWWV